MADPGAEPIVSVCIEDFDLRADLLYTGDVFAGSACFHFLVRCRSKEPDCVAEKVGIGKFNTGILLAGHGVSA